MGCAARSNQGLRRCGTERVCERERATGSCQVPAAGLRDPTRGCARAGTQQSYLACQRRFSLFFPFPRASPPTSSLTRFSVRTTRSGKEFSAYAVGEAVACDLDFSALLHGRVEALAEGCDSEDELDLEGDGDGEDGDDVDGGALPGPSKPSSKAPAGLKRTRRDSASSECTLSDLSSDSDAPPSTPCKENHRKRNKRKRRARDRQGEGPLKATWLRHKAAADPVLLKGFDVSSLPVSSSGFAGRKKPSFRSSFSLEDLLGRGFTLVKKEGAGARPLVDKNGLAFGLVHCQPRDEKSWGKVVRGLERGVSEGITGLTFTEKQRLHKRGRFPAINVGVGFGGGRKVAGNIRLGKKQGRFMYGLLRRRSFKRWSGFMNQVFMTFNPAMYAEYKAKTDLLFSSDSSLRRNFKNSVFAALAINFAKCVEGDGHTDNNNRPDGWCGITAIGEFDHKESAHLVLWEAKLVIEFPRGSTAYIPSAVVTHFTLPVREGQTRQSMTQYTGGGLFRWVYNGFCSDIAWYAKASPSEKAQRERERKRRWADGLALFPSINTPINKP